jgi:uncharacterized membrane protein
VGAFGLVLAGPVLSAAARRGGLPTAAALHRLQGGVVAQVVSWGGALVLAAGLYLTVDGPYDLGDPWVGATFAILIVLLGLSGAYFAPRERRLADLAEAGGGGDYDGLARQVRTVGWVAAALVLVAVFLMVTKPGS